MKNAQLVIAMVVGVFVAWVERFFAKRGELGLTNVERRQVLAVAKRGELGRDRAEELACHGFGITTSQFYALLQREGISTR